jgi:hypothetical protein
VPYYVGRLRRVRNVGGIPWVYYVGPDVGLRADATNPGAIDWNSLEQALQNKVQVNRITVITLSYRVYYGKKRTILILNFHCVSQG